jgi:glycosyltransferase involved in cell wall biosynthesis
MSETQTGRLRIVQVLSNSPNALPVPPTNQGGTEKIVYELTEELVRRGHEVILFAARGSTSSAQVKAYPRQLRESGLGRYVVRRLPPGVDIIHDHSFSSAVGRMFLRTPTVCTHHIPVRNRVLHPVYVSERALQAVGGNSGTFIHNGIDPDEYQFSAEKQDYLLFIGRLLREKGIVQALDVAERTGERLVIAGPIKDRKLFDKAIAPRLRANPKLEYAGAVGGQRKQDLLKHAKAVLFPSIWEEPFGLVIIEAMACGTPVLALRNGAVPEVMAGFPNLICRSVDEMVRKVRNEPLPEPEALRQYVTERFTTAKMADRYLELYGEVMAAGLRGKARPKAGQRQGRRAAKMPRLARRPKPALGRRGRSAAPAPGPLLLYARRKSAGYRQVPGASAPHMAKRASSGS